MPIAWFMRARWRIENLFKYLDFYGIDFLTDYHFTIEANTRKVDNPQRTKLKAELTTLTAERDDFTSAKWDGVLESHDLRGIQVSDFDVVDFGPVEEYDSLPDCVLDNPLP